MRKIFITLALLTVVSGAQAQKQKETFEAFRKDILNQFSQRNAESLCRLLGCGVEGL